MKNIIELIVDCSSLIPCCKIRFAPPANHLLSILIDMITFYSVLIAYFWEYVAWSERGGLGSSTSGGPWASPGTSWCSHWTPAL